MSYLSKFTNKDGKSYEIKDRRIPIAGTADKDKYLHVNKTTGVFEWDTVPSDFPDPTELNNGTAMVVVDGEWTQQEGYGYRYQGTSTLADEEITCSDDIFGIGFPANLFSVTFELVAGNTYIVGFNGTEHEEVAYENPQLLGATVIGDMSNGYIIGYLNGNSVLAVYQAGTYSVSVASVGEQIQQIDENLTGIATKMDMINPVGQGSFSMGRKADTEIGVNSHAEGYDTTASGQNSHAEGYSTIASGQTSHAEGYSTEANGTFSHAEGGSTIAGTCAHAEGSSTIAEGEDSHAEGYNTATRARYSHAEGKDAIANGEGSHAEGYSTIAQGDYSHVQGKYNVDDVDSIYADIIGGGSDNSNRKNIEATTWTGDKKLKGDVYVHCNDDSTGGSKLATEQWVEAKGYVDATYHDSSKQDTISDLAAIRSNASAGAGLVGKVSAQASTTNKLVSASEMGDAIASVEAKQLYATNAQGSFATKATLTSATTFYNADGTVATPTKNDVAYVLVDESHDGKSTKYVVASVNPLVWGFVIAFSTLSFTQAQMNAINSNITDVKRQGYDSHIVDASIHVAVGEKNTWNAKQDAISDLDTIRSGASAGATAYQKPSTGIPKAALESAVQTSLGKADTALQSHQSASAVNGTNIGSATKGVYINASGKPTAMTYSLNKTVPSDAVFTDTTYSDATTSVHGLMSTTDKTKLNGIATGATNVVESTVSGWGFTKNTGTITGITMNGASKGTSGVVDLGTVITSHQSLSAYYTSAQTDTAIANAIGVAIGGAY